MRVVAIVQARMGSSRLPGKVMLKLENHSILEHIINFLKFSELIDKIVIATTTIPEDDVIVELCNKINVNCFRGSSKDVLKRFYESQSGHKGYR